MTLPAAIRQAVEDSLCVRFGGQVSIAGDVQNFSPSSVFRCTLQSPCSDVPETVIVRILREGGARSGQIGLDFLAAIGSSIAPRYIAGGSAAGFLVTEDMGTSPSLLDLLLGKDAEAARQGSIAFARGLGRLHAQTARRSREQRNTLPVVHVPIAKHWQQVCAAVAQLELPMPQGVDNDVLALTHLLAEPNDCFTLSSGDCSVVNCMITSCSVRFFDFEEACFRHALIDAVVLRYPYPTGGPPWRLPHEVAIEMESTYRMELAQACPVVLNENYYERGMAAVCAAWTIIRLARLPKVVAGPNCDPWLLLPPDWSAPVSSRSRRRQLVSILETCVVSARYAGAFEAFAAWCECLTSALRERWTEAAEELPLYPAFL